MTNDEEDKIICAKLLETFQVAKHIKPSDIKNLRIHRTQQYALSTILAFDYNDKHYYVSDDYSIGSDPQHYVRNLLEDINHLLKGKLLKNPTPQTDGSQYAAGIDGVEYYLWESPLL